MYDLFVNYLQDRNLAKNTIFAYVAAVKQFHILYDSITKQYLRDYKIFLIETYKPQTVNLRIRAINCYLSFLHQEDLKISTIKVQQKSFLENVISEADYLYFKNSLKRDGEWYWYFVVRFLAATGARVNELIELKVEHVKTGYLDIYGKGGKLRRIYIPISLQKEALEWLSRTGRQSGFIFLNKKGNRITARGIASQLKYYGNRYKLDPAVVHPHSFRHRFAKSFLERYSDLALLADLMGHESIETTRIYLRRTSTEQQNIVNQIIDW